MCNSDSIDNSADTIDSRDIIARMEYLRDLESPDEADAAELAALRALEAEAENYVLDWRYGVTLVRYSYFRDYAQQLADDLGAINPDASWPNDCIDWERAARELQQDYTEVSFDGVSYWVR